MLDLRARVQVHQAQAEFVRSNAIYRGLVGGIGSGKSFGGAYDLLRRARPGRLYMALSATYTMLQDASLRTFLGLARELHLLSDYLRGDRIAKLRNGAEVLFRSADDPERMRGPNLSGLWLDEASQMHRESFEIGIGRLRESGQQGWLSATFTPKGRSHWTYEQFATGRPNTALFRARTDENPFAPEGFADTIREQYSGLLAQQELDGEFVNIEGAEWPADYFPDGMWFEDWPSDIVLRTVACDPSKGKDSKSGDYSAIVELGRCREGLLWCEADLGRRPTEQIVHALIERSRLCHPVAVAVETNQFQELLMTQAVAEARRQGVILPVVGVVNTVNKQVRIRRLGPHLARHSIRFRNTPGTRLLVEQLREFPEGKHDDGPDCLEVALRVMIEMWNGRTAHRATRATA